MSRTLKNITLVLATCAAFVFLIAAASAQNDVKKERDQKNENIAQNDKYAPKTDNGALEDSETKLEKKQDRRRAKSEEAVPEDDEKVEEPTEDGEKVEKPTEDGEKVEKPTEDDEKVEKPTEDDEKVKEPTEDGEKEEETEAEEDALDEALDNPLDAGEKENSAEELLNLATELKLSASTILDLSKVIAYCAEAEKKGLDETNLEFARQLGLSARLDRGLAVAQIFLNPDAQKEQFPRGWKTLRDKAIEDLETALADESDLPIAQLALGRLYEFSEELDKAKEAFDRAAGVDADPEIKTQALKFRAEMETSVYKSLEVVRKAVEIAPEDVALRSKFAELLAMANRLDEALAQIEKALELDPENKTSMQVKANFLAEAGRVDEAIALFEEATVDVDESNLFAQIDKGRFLLATHEYDKALEHFDALVKKYDAPGFYYFRAVAYAQLKDYKNALADVNRTLRLDSSMIGALRLKGILYIEEEKFDDAIRIFEQLKRKSDDPLDALTQLAFAKAKQGYYKKAVEILDDALAEDPDSVDVLRSFADMELLFGHWAAAKEKYDRLLELVPEDSAVLNNYSWLLATCPDDSIRNAEKALEYGLKACEKTLYGAPHILSTLAAAYAESGDFEKAREFAGKAVELGEKQRHESLDNLKKELESYNGDQPWRETSSDLVEELDADENDD